MIFCCEFVSTQILQKKTLGQSVFDYVLRKLDLLERDYFGLQYEDEQKSLVNEHYNNYYVQMYTVYIYICRILTRTWVEYC